MTSLHELLRNPPDRLRVTVTPQDVTIRHSSQRPILLVGPVLAFLWTIVLTTVMGAAVLVIKTISVSLGLFGLIFGIAMLAVVTLAMLWWVTEPELVLTPHVLTQRRVWLKWHRHIEHIPLSTLAGSTVEQVTRPQNGYPGVNRLRTVHTDDTPPMMLAHNWSQEERDWLGLVLRHACHAAGDATAESIPRTLQALRATKNKR